MRGVRMQSPDVQADAPALRQQVLGEPGDQRFHAAYNELPVDEEKMLGAAGGNSNLRLVLLRADCLCTPHVARPSRRFTLNVKTFTPAGPTI